MSFSLVDVEITAPYPEIRLGDTDVGVAIVSRHDGRVVGFALHPMEPGAVIGPEHVEGLLDPRPVDPPTLRSSVARIPSITVAICTRNRAALLRECVKSLRSLDDRPDEIIVVDNAPTDESTRAVAVELGVRYAIEPRPGLDFARNVALRTSRSDVVAFVDDDVIVDQFWFGALQAAWSQHRDAGMVTGQVLPIVLETDAQVAFERRGGFRGGNLLVRYSGQDLDGDPIYPYHPGLFGTGANMSIRRDVALRLGGFDEALDTGPPLAGGGDLDMTHRTVRAGRVLVYEPRAVVFHRHRRDTASLRQQYNSWGRSLMAFVTKTYRLDPAGRPKLRRLIRWFFITQLREARRALPAADRSNQAAAAAELRGAVVGLLGEYGRSQRRSRRHRRRAGRPTVAILPWRDLEDYTDPLRMSIDEYAEQLTGGWLFGFVEGLASAGVDSVIVCWSRNVKRPTRRYHVPTGAVLWLLPPSRLHLAARARPASAVARNLSPYLGTTLAALTRVLRDEACTAVLCQEYEEGRFDLCVGLGKLLRIPVFATFQGGDQTRTRLERHIRKTAIRASAGLVVAAESEATRVRERYHIRPDRIARIPNPLDPTTVMTTPKTQAREAFGIADTATVVLWMGRVEMMAKGIDILIDAWCTIRDSCRTPVTLLLLGTGSDAPWLHQRLAEIGSHDVLWRDEYVLDRTVIGAYLSAADVYALPSRHEGFAVAPLEAMAAGLPVVAADGPGIRSLLGNGADAGGVIVPSGDAASFASEVCRLIDDPSRALALGALAKQRAESQFSLTQVGAQLRGFLINGKSP